MSVGILRICSKNWTSATLSVFITCTMVAFEYRGEYYSHFVGLVFLIENWMMVRTPIGIPDSTVI